MCEPYKGGGESEGEGEGEREGDGTGSARRKKRVRTSTPVYTNADFTAEDDDVYQWVVIHPFNHKGISCS